MLWPQRDIFERRLFDYSNRKKMNSDVSYIIQIPVQNKNIALEELAKFCVNTRDHRFDRNLISEKCDLSFLIPDEGKTRWFKQSQSFADVIPGKTLIGRIVFWMEEKGTCCSFTFWPQSTLLGRVCKDSEELKNAFLEFAIQSDAYSLQVDKGNGWLETIYGGEHR